ncbi:hypothetical protein B566_EDAN000297 [Ephemera danica]|nr:hypothetical protein B566_EDAN000297 [Ephemera danica]
MLMSYSIGVKELKTRLDHGDKLVLLDVREPWEHALAKLEGSVLIPLGTLPQSLTKLDKNTEIIAYCHHGMRSADATGFLVQQGFANVKNLVGGIDAWSIQVRKHECCGQKIGYFLEREHQIRFSMPKIYEILAKTYVIRSKWQQRQKRGAVPTASAPRAVIQ